MKTTITLGVNTANQLRMFKIKCKVKNLDAVIKLLIKTYRAYKKESLYIDPLGKVGVEK
uniref:Uncharacterized protein n=1 Tax=viral metagenome TaxID=1070528 RepID=A0A6H1ZVI3_9ZZZZ